MQPGIQQPESLHRLAIRSQREVIAQYRNELSARLGRSVSLDEAARCWIPEFASEWRTEFEAALAASRSPVTFLPSFPDESEPEAGKTKSTHGGESWKSTDHS
mgnify:CR=1 FL=1